MSRQAFDHSPVFSLIATSGGERLPGRFNGRVISSGCAATLPPPEM